MLEATESPVVTESIACNQCGSKASHVIASGTDREYFTASDTFTVVQCDQCSLIYLNPRPATSELPRIYPPSFHSYITAVRFSEGDCVK
jgi:hypothetical protein